MSELDDYGFWTGKPVEDPDLQFRFRVLHKGEFLWWAKSCDKPKINIPVLAKDEYYLGTGLPDTQPGEIVDFQPITMVMVNPRGGGAMNPIELLVKFQGLDSENFEGCWPRIHGSSFRETWSGLTIETVDHLGNAVEQWDLHNCFPTSIDFGSLSYDSHDLVEITITWEYTSFDMYSMGSKSMIPKIKTQGLTYTSDKDHWRDQTGQWAEDLDGGYT